jgi:hypothetical protein
VSQSVRLALEADIDGADSFIIAAVPVADHVDGTDTLPDITNAREGLGYAPDFTWRQILT